MAKTTLTDQDLDNIQARTTASVLEAIGHHEESCGNKNDKIYVQKGTCNRIRDKCKREMYKSITNKHKPQAPIMSEPQDKTEEPDATVTFSFGNHVQKNWWKYVLLAISAGCLALMGIPMIGPG